MGDLTSDVTSVSVVPIRVHLCVGDRRLVRVLRELLGEDDAVDLTGTSAEVVAAAIVLDEAEVDVVVVDIDLVMSGGCAAVPPLARRGDGSHRGVVLVGETHVRIDFVRAALTAGARAVLPVVLTATDLRAALRAVHRGHAWLSRTAVAALLDQPSTDVPLGVDGFAGRHGLTARECEVLRLVVTGARNADIATELCLAVRTVKHHHSSVLRKTGARDRAHLIAMALSPAASPLADRTGACGRVIVYGATSELSPGPMRSTAPERQNRPTAAVGGTPRPRKPYRQEVSGDAELGST